MGVAGFGSACRSGSVLGRAGRGATSWGRTRTARALVGRPGRSSSLVGCSGSRRPGRTCGTVVESTTCSSVVGPAGTCRVRARGRRLGTAGGGARFAPHRSSVVGGSGSRRARNPAGFCTARPGLERARARVGYVQD